MSALLRPRRWPRGPRVVGLVAALLAAAWLVPGLASRGFWSGAELPVLHRTLAELGGRFADLVRSPMVPDTARTWSYQLLGRFDAELALRLPHALSVAALVGLAAGIARWRGATLGMAILTGGFVLAFPVNQVGGQTALGNPLAETSITAAIVAGMLALHGTGVRSLVATVVALLSVAGAVGAAGLLLGAGIPSLAIAAAAPPQRARMRPLLWATASVVIGISIMLMFRQGDGYLPILAAAKDLDVLERPYDRRFAAGLEDLGHQLFPWLPLILLGVLYPGRDRWPALWLLLGLLLGSGWTVIYGPTPLPLSVPAALCCIAAIEGLTGPHRGPATRRWALLWITFGSLIMAKDAQRVPERIAAPVHEFTGKASYPAEALEADKRLRFSSYLVLVGLWGVALLGADGPAGRWMARRGDRLGRWLPRFAPQAIVGALLAHQIAVFSLRLLPESSNLLSPHTLLARYQKWADAGLFPERLTVLRVDDEGLEHYGPSPNRRERFERRRALAEAFATAAPRIALIRKNDLAFLHLRHREQDWPLFVLDDSHADLMLVSNRLPTGFVDKNPIREIVLDEPPKLRNQTLVRFQDRLELVGWEVEQPVVRGTERTLKMVFRVLRPLPGGTKLYARLLKGRTSRINPKPHDLAESLYPPPYWREGDFILHRYTFEVPVLEVFPGQHDVLVALRRSQRSNFEITIPEGKRGEFGVVIRNKARTFARIGEVEVW